MRRALLGENGPLVTVEEFIRRAGSHYAAAGIFPYCRVCGERVEVYGANSPNVVSRFDHQNRSPDASPLDDCRLANRAPDKRFQGLEPSEWDEGQAAAFKEQFFAPENIKGAYGFMWSMCHRGNLPREVFVKCIERANRKQIWAYKNIPLWAVPFILLTLGDFMHREKGYPFRFVFIKPSRTTADALWDGTRDVKIQKVFADTGNLVSSNGSSFPVSSETYYSQQGNIDWIEGTFLSWLSSLKNA